MVRGNNLIALLFVASLLCAQNPGPPVISEPSAGRFRFLAEPYEPKTVSRVDPNNSPRIYELLRAGNLYLSLADAIALAMENNLDVQYLRYQIPMASTDVLRSKGGGTLRGIGLSVFELPPGLGGPASPLVTGAATGATPGTSVPNNVYDPSQLAETAASLALATDSLASPLPSAAGPAIPAYDPAVVASLGWTQQATPEANSLIAGASVLRSATTNFGLNLTQGFSTGTQYSLGYNSSSLSENSIHNNFNPYTTGGLGLTVSQPLLRGFGIAMNRRWIMVAKNDQRISDEIFRQEVINVIYGISRLYYDLAGLTEDLRVKQDTLKAAQVLFEDTKAGVEEGTLAPVEMTRAEAEVSGAEEDLINSQGLLEEQETIIKNVLTRKGGREPAIQAAHIIPTEVLAVPQKDSLGTVAELLPEALAKRPDVRQAKLQLSNFEIALKGSRNELLPAVDLVATVQDNALSGQTNAAFSSIGTGVSSTGIDPVLLGGYSNLLDQILTHKFPMYAVGVQLNLPVRNRVAEADVTRDELQLRSYQTRFLQLQNQVEMELEAALIAVRRSRAAYDAAMRTRVLQAQSLDVEQARFEAGIDTAFFVIQYQSYLAQARSTEVVARGNYFKARAALDRATGSSLEVNNVSFHQAYQGAPAHH